MSRAKDYYRLQQLDSDIDAKTARLAAVTAALGQRDTVDALKSAFEQTQAALSEARSRQRDLEWELEQTKQKLAQVEKKMYGGSVTNPRQLDDLRQESEHLRRRRGELQDLILDAMMVVEELEGQTGTQHEVWTGAELAWAEEQEALHAEEIALREELAALRTERREQAARLDAAGLDKYEQKERPGRGALARHNVRGLSSVSALRRRAKGPRRRRGELLPALRPHPGLRRADIGGETTLRTWRKLSVCGTWRT